MSDSPEIYTCPQTRKLCYFGCEKQEDHVCYLSVPGNVKETPSLFNDFIDLVSRERDRRDRDNELMIKKINKMHS